MRPTKTWICEVISRAVKTVIVEAASRKDAIVKLRSGEGEGIDVNYDLRGLRVVGREDLLKRRYSKQQTKAVIKNCTIPGGRCQDRCFDGLCGKIGRCSWQSSF